MSRRTPLDLFLAGLLATGSVRGRGLWGGGERHSAQTVRDRPSWTLPESPRLQDGKDAFAEPVCLLQVWVARQDELIDPQFVVFGDAVRHLGVAAHERGSGPSAHQTHSCPQVGRYLAIVAGSAVQSD